MTLVHGWLRTLKNRILPPGERYRKIPFGVMSGNIMKIDFRYQFRQYLGMYEFELNSHFKSLIKPGYKCFDVGGKGGYNALMLSKLSHGGDVVTFECDSNAVNDLKEVVAKNKWPIQVVKAFVSNQMNNEHKTIDWAMAQFFCPDFIKIDIEGAEVMALQGAHEVLSKRKPGLIIETHSLELENNCIKLLKKYGYDHKIIDQSKIFPERRQVFTHNRWLVCKGTI